MKLKYGLIGYGKAAQKHEYAINNNNGEVIRIYDPALKDSYPNLDYAFFKDLDYAVICSPSYLHREQVKLALSSLPYDKQIIVEKPLVLPWEPMIDDNRINIVLQLRWMDLPERADVVEAIMVRDDEYYKRWEGDPLKTGGMFYHLFIHYIDLAIKLNARFEGKILPEGKQLRRVDDIDIQTIDMNLLYDKMYHDIIHYDKGVKPSDIFYIHWILERCGGKYGFADRYEDGVELDFKLGVDV